MKLQVRQMTDLSLCQNFIGSGSLQFLGDGDADVLSLFQQVMVVGLCYDTGEIRAGLSLHRQVPAYSEYGHYTPPLDIWSR